MIPQNIFDRAILHVARGADMAAIDAPLQCTRNPRTTHPVVPSIRELCDMTLVGIDYLSLSVSSWEGIVDSIAQVIIVISLQALNWGDQCE